ncbi:MAG: RdgB/HAM1 family non-canonical purine NTP pyrophosphatase [bacterium]|nr:RdgB/HAM1 family non-canonical purine NTP pyrophosphatase [bacterium]
MPKELCFVTSNKNKAKEAEEILGLPVQNIEKDIPEIQSMDLNKVVEEKAQEAYKLVNKPLFVEDVGVYVEAWNGFPGPFTRYLYDCGGAELFVRMMNTEKNRNVVAKVAIGFHDGKQVHALMGEIKGVIAGEVKGSHGWGWDPIFIPQGYDKTFSELGPEIKNRISHRRAALQKFKKFLETYL